MPPPSPVSQGEADYGVVLDMVENLMDKLSALNLDNDNIRVACDALRRQCQDQGVAFGDLTKLVRESLDGRPPQRPQTETGRPHPIIRSDLIDDRGNLRAADIGITWHGGDTFLHGVRVVRTNEDTEHIRPRPATSTPYSPVREHPPCGMSTPRSTHPVCLETPAIPAHRTGQDVQVTGRQHRYSGSLTRPSVGRRGSVSLKPLPTFTDGTKTRGHYNSSHTSTRKRRMLHRSCLTRNSTIMMFSSSY